MTQKQHFTQNEWNALMKATALAGIGLINADKGGFLDVIRELVAYATALVNAEADYKSNVLLLTIIQELREDDKKQFHDLQASALQTDNKSEILKYIENAVDIIKNRASDIDYATYKHFLMQLLTKIAETADEGTLGTSKNAISPKEQKFLNEVEEILS